MGEGSPFSASVLAELREAFDPALVERVAWSVAQRVAQGLVGGPPDSYLVGAVRNEAARVAGGNGGGFGGQWGGAPRPAYGGGRGRAEPAAPKPRTYRPDGSMYECSEGVRSATHHALNALVREVAEHLLTPAECAARVEASALLTEAVSPWTLAHWRGLGRFEAWQGAGLFASRCADTHLASWGGRYPWLRQPEAWLASCQQWRELSGSDEEAGSLEEARAALAGFPLPAGTLA